MPLSLIILCLWALAAGAVAMLPMRHQFVPGFALLLAIVPLLIWVGIEAGWLFAAVGGFACVSMFRKPLRYFARRALGRAE